MSSGMSGMPFPFPHKIISSHGYLYPHLICGSLGPPDSASQRASRSVQPFFAEIMAESSCTLQWALLSPKIAPSHGGSGSHLIQDSLFASKPTTQTASPSVSRFCTDDRKVSLYFTMGRPLPPKIAHFLGNLDLSNMWFLGPPPHPSPQSKWHLDRFSRFGGLTTVTDGQTDRPRYLVSNNRHVYVHSTAMQPSNNRQFVNNRDIVYGAVFMTIARVLPVDFMNAD